MSAAENLITQNLDIWATAIKAKSSAGRGTSKKIELYGVKKLRELILELAVRGLLVPQDPNDEPACALLKKIAAEKAKLVKDGKIKKEKPLPPIKEEEKPFKLPEGWEWARCQSVSTYIQRGKGPRYSDSGKVRVVSQKCVQWNGFNLELARFIEDESASEYTEERYLQSSDILWNSTGTGTVGRVVKVPIIEGNSLVADSHVTILRTKHVNNSFLVTYLSSPGIQRRMDPQTEKPLVSGTTNQVELNTSSVCAVEIPIPPLSEQHRIVAKVDELMAVVDKLEAQQENSIDAHKTLVDTLLAALTNASQKGEFEAAWKLIAEHFDTLFTTENSITQLKSSILQLAVMGKLVPQDPRDEPANELLKRISSEKAKLVKEGKIKKQKPLPPLKEKEKAFELPKGWEWAYLGSLSSDIHYGYTASAEHESDGIRLLRITDIQNDRVKWQTVPSCEITDKKAETYLLENDDVLIARTGGTIGKSYLVENIDVRAVFASYLIRVRRISSMYSPFIKTYLGSLIYWKQLYDNAAGTGQPNVNATALKQLLVPIPPKSEQHRIVAKVDELMALCDNLKEQINNSQIIQLKAADSLAGQALT